MSLAASKVVLERHQNEDICGALSTIGDSLHKRVQIILDQNGLSEVISFSGHDSWKFLNWKPTEQYSVDLLRTYFMQEMFKSGVLILGTHNVSLSHSGGPTKTIEYAYQKGVTEMSKRITSGNLNEFLNVQPLTPLFRLR